MTPIEGTEYCEISSAEALIIGILVAPIYIVFAYLYNEAVRGFAGACSGGVVVTLIWALRPLVKKRVFWASIFGISIAHLVLILLLPSSGRISFGFAFFPIVFLDIYVSGKSIIYLCRKYATEN